LPEPVIAFGSELKNTVCVAAGKQAAVSDTHGDLGEAADYRRFAETVRLLRESDSLPDPIIAHDLHPMYLSTVLARQQETKLVPVQHHHAHAVSCAVDAGIECPVIGVVCDGAGYGTDGAIWGGEVLYCEAASFKRMSHLSYFGLPGGDAAAKATWRPALSVLQSAFPDDWRSIDVPLLKSVNGRERSLVMRQLDVGLNTPDTSSLGRMFDAVACLTGVCADNQYEGQAAIELEAAADGYLGEPYGFDMHESDGPLRLDWRPMVRSVVKDVLSGAALREVSARFHATVVAMFANACMRSVEATGLGRVVLSGGCLFNKLLREGLTRSLARQNMKVALHGKLSPGDAGLSLGQAVVASFKAHLPAGQGD
jgi:hydrogenase maturation protein HypF